MENDAVTYWYEGHCPQTGRWLRLPRTRQAEAIAQTLMVELAGDERFNQEGKMYGVLLAQDQTGQKQILKAFSGLLNGESVLAGWVPPLPGRATVAFEEAFTLSQLDAIKQELMDLHNIPARSHLATLTQQQTAELQALTIAHQQRKQVRQQKRQHLQETLTGDELAQALAQLNQESQQDGMQRRRLKTQHHTKLQSLTQQVETADLRMHQLKQQRKKLSRQLQEQLYAAYQLTNFAGQSTALHQLMPNGLLPTGTGDCCAPKLLHSAAVQGWRPLAMAEFWWGTPSAQEDKRPGEFYGACRDRCQPIMGFLLGGVGSPELGFDVSAVRLSLPSKPQPNGVRSQEIGEEALPILYEDGWIVVVEKPAGLLSVPGRYRDRQDSVWSRLQAVYPGIRVVHRLDQDTSGILVLARDLSTHQHLARQFQQRQVDKRYEAILAGQVGRQEGVIELPLWGDPRDRPRQTVDWHRGKPSTTKFRVLSSEPQGTRIEVFPLTGRTHQIRLHAAHPQGLGVPIVGDRLYGSLPNPLPDDTLMEGDDLAGMRLQLHAKALTIQHPHTGRSLSVQSPVPF